MVVSIILKFILFIVANIAMIKNDISIINWEWWAITVGYIVGAGIPYK